LTGKKVSILAKNCQNTLSF